MAIKITVLILIFLGSLGYYRHREEQRVQREAEVAKAVASEIEDRMLKLNSAAVRLESALRKKDFQTDRVVAVNVDTEKQSLTLVVTKLWFEQPEQTKRQMLESVALLLKEFAPPDGIPFFVSTQN